MQTTIQSYYRGYLARQFVFVAKKYNQGAARIQRHVRSFLLRLEEQQEAFLQVVLTRRIEAALLIQRFWRKRKAEEELAVATLVSFFNLQRINSLRGLLHSLVYNFVILFC